MNSDAGPNIGAQALAGVLTVLAVLLAMRTAYRTIRSTVSLTLWLLKWGVVLYVVLLGVLWWAEPDGSSMHSSLSTVHSILRFSSTALVSVTVRAVQNPGLFVAFAQQIATALNPPKKKRGPLRPRSQRTRTQRTNDEASLHELASSLGLEDMLDSVLTFQDPETKPKREKKRNPFWK
ncbi:hypothetical protein MVES_002795 [Malassezia vespertilionis]|uniref:Uncharacterized protein n=1 Tax=Malassezia vespertilionis TaxID=2020962 RepID=A0A2N1J9S3_9BASI|nr:hypothetical protein MVES_002795 [Malassezia vespertilionis]